MAFAQRVAVMPRAMVWLQAEWTDAGAEVEARELAQIQGSAARIGEILRRNRAVVG